MKQHKHPFTEEWVNKMWYVDAKEYYAIFKSKVSKITYVTKWMNLEGSFAKWHKPAIKREILYGSTCMK